MACVIYNQYFGLKVLERWNLKKCNGTVFQKGVLSKTLFILKIITFLSVWKTCLYITYKIEQSETP